MRCVRRNTGRNAQDVWCANIRRKMLHEVCMKGGMLRLGCTRCLCDRQECTKGVCVRGERVHKKRVFRTSQEIPPQLKSSENWWLFQVLQELLAGEVVQLPALDVLGEHRSPRW